MRPRLHEVVTPDGRTLEVWASPGQDRNALLMIHGTPSSGLPWDDEHAAAVAAGVGYATYSRPGYGGSTRHRGRSVADAAADVEIIARTLELETLFVVGASGGGPHALACAALLPDLVASAATVGGVAPWDAEGLDWLAGMAEENVVEFGATLRGEAALTEALEPLVAAFVSVTADEIADAFGGLVSEVDRASLTDAFAEITATRSRHALRNGPGGWIDDDLAFVRAWGFSLEAIRCPTVVWQGGQDLMVPPAHGTWLAAHVPGAVPRLLPEDGHLSLIVGRVTEYVADLVARGRSGR